MKTNKWRIALSVSLAAFALLGIFTLYQNHRVNQYKEQLENKYNRSFYEMVGYVSNVDAHLIKSMVTTTPEKTTNYLEETWRNAALAQTILTELPLSQGVLAGMSKYLVQVGDYAYTLSVECAGGKVLTKEQHKTLGDMQKYANELNENLGEIMRDMAEGNMSWKDLEQAGDEVDGMSVANLVKTFAEYPSLIYDGPFSDHIPQIEPKGVTGAEISKEEAENRIRQYYEGQALSAIEYYADTTETKIPVYRYQVTFEGSGDKSYIDVTKTGGYIYWELKSRDIGVNKLSVEDAKKKGKEFLEQKGFPDMKDSYYTNENGIATINYIYYKHDIKYYPDMIKVRVALDNGEILGMEAKSYLYSHAGREKPEIKLSQDEATQKVSAHLELKSSGLAVIPTEFHTEVLVYEFIGKMNEKDLLVYINANTGEEEDVLIILDTDQGILTQ